MKGIFLFVSTLLCISCFSQKKFNVYLGSGNAATNVSYLNTKIDSVANKKVNGAGVTIRGVNQIYTMGNSITAVGHFQTKLSTLLDSSWSIVNLGISGNTTGNMLYRFDKVAYSGADYVIIMGGVNDISATSPYLTIRDNLQSMYTAAKNAGMKVIAITILPCGQYSGWNPSKQTALESINKWIKDSAINVDYRINGYAALESQSTPTYLNSAYDTGDHLHPNSTGLYVLGQLIYDNVVFTNKPTPTFKIPSSATFGDVTGNRAFNNISTDTLKFQKIKMLSLEPAPVASNSTGNYGEVRITSTGIYVCIAANTWIKCTGSTF